MRLGSCLIGLIVFSIGSLAHAADAKQLAATLGSGSAADRRAAADALADMGSAAQDAVPQLITALAADDAELQWRAARALGIIGDANANGALRKATTDSDAIVRAQAIFALGRMKADDKDSLASV